MTEPATHKGALLDPEECLALIERIAASEQFRRATRLREILFYVGNRSLKEGCDRIHEQEIGSRVFGRDESYDSSVDNIVRTNVSELRKRIEAYFHSEGSHETLIMEIPRGNYAPVFQLRGAEAETEANSPARIHVPALEPTEAIRESPRTSYRRRMPWGITIAALFIALVAVGCALYFWGQYRALHRTLYAWQYKPSVAALWSGILNARPNTDIVISDTSIGLAQTLTKSKFSIKDYLSHDYIGQLQAENLSPDTRAAVNRILAWSLGSPDEFRLANRILALDPLGRKIHLYTARDYMPDLIKRDNVILIGARKSNPWDELFENRANFITRFDNNGVITVINRSPAAGEPPVYTETDSVEYCVVAYLPNPDQNGIVLLIEGTDAEATEAAGDFLLSEDQLSDFKKMLHVNKLPYFEVVLKVSSVRGTPLTATIAAYRAYPQR